MPPTLPPPAPLLSPAERAYIRASLALSPPVRPDGRGPTQFRPLRAETDVLPGTYGSARAAGPDGAEVVVGVKAEVERLDSGTEAPGGSGGYAAQARPTDAPATGEDHDGADEDEELPDWLQLSIDVPGHRDDDDLVVFLSALLAEALAGGVAGWMLHRRLRGGTRWRWKLYVDVRPATCPSFHGLNANIKSSFSVADAVCRSFSSPHHSPTPSRSSRWLRT